MNFVDVGHLERDSKDKEWEDMVFKWIVAILHIWITHQIIWLHYETGNTFRQGGHLCLAVAAEIGLNS